MNDLMTSGMSVRYLGAYAGDNFCVAFDELHQAGGVEWGKVVGIVSAGQFGNVAVGILPFGSLDEMSSPGKRWVELTSGVTVSGAAGVVEMEVSQEHPIKIACYDSGGGQILYKRCSILGRVPL